MFGGLKLGQCIGFTVSNFKQKNPNHFHSISLFTFNHSKKANNLFYTFYASNYTTSSTIIERISRKSRRTNAFTQYLNRILTTEITTPSVHKACSQLSTITSPFPEEELYTKFVTKSNLDRNYHITIEAINEIYPSISPYTIQPIPYSSFALLEKIIPEILLPIPLNSLNKTQKKEETNLEIIAKDFYQWIEDCQFSDLNNHILSNAFFAFGKLKLKHRIDHLFLLIISIQHLHLHFRHNISTNSIYFDRFKNFEQLLGRSILTSIISSYCTCGEGKKAVNLFNYFNSELTDEISVYHSLFSYYLDTKEITPEDLETIVEILNRLTSRNDDKIVQSQVKLKINRDSEKRIEQVRQNPYTLKKNKINTDNNNADQNSTERSSILFNNRGTKMANITTFNLFFEICLKRNEIELALEWKKKLKEYQIKIDERSFIIFANIYSTYLANHYEKFSDYSSGIITTIDLRELYKEAKLSIQKPTILLFHSFLRAFGKCRDIPFTVKTFSEMFETFKISPTPMTYEILIRAFIGFRDVRGVERILDLSENDPSGVKPSIIIYNEILKFYISLNDLEGTMNFLTKMKNYYYVKPNEESFRMVLNAFVTKTKNSQKIGELYAEMKLFHFYPTEEMYENMIYLFSEDPEDAHRAMTLYRDMVSFKYILSERLLRTLIFATERAHLYNETELLHNDYKKRFKKELFKGINNN